MKVRLGSVSLRSPSPSPSPSPSSICLPSVSRRTGILYDLHEIVDAIVVLTSRERRVDRLVGFTREDRSKRVGSHLGSGVGSPLGSYKVSGSLGCVSGPSRVRVGSSENRKIRKKDPRRPESGRRRVSRVRRKREIAVSLCHRAPKRTIRVGE